MPGGVSDCPGCVTLAAEVARLEEALTFEVSRRCLGGSPPACDDGWANLALPPPESASDPNLTARPSGMASSLDPRHWA